MAVAAAGSHHSFSSKFSSLSTSCGARHCKGDALAVVAGQRSPGSAANLPRRLQPLLVLLLELPCSSTACNWSLVHLPVLPRLLMSGATAPARPLPLRVLAKLLCATAAVLGCIACEGARR